MHHWRSNVESVPQMLRHMREYQVHAAEWLAHLVDVLATRPHADMPIPLVPVCNRLAHRLLPDGDNVRISREVVGIDEPQRNVGRPKIPIGYKIIQISGVASE